MTDPSTPASKAEIAPHAHYMRPLDGLRGLACMLVIVSHITLVLNFTHRPDYSYLGALGVLMFFALSGFLMSALYTNEAFTFDKTAKYGIARFTRIAPAYWIAVIFVWVLYQFVPDFHYRMTAFNTARAFAFMGNQGVLWSIPPEVQFYGFFVLLWFAWAKFKQGSKLWLILMAVLCIGLVCSREMWGGLMLPSKLHIFLSGFLAAFLIRIPRVSKIIHTVWFQLLIAVIAIAYGKCFTTLDTIYGDVVLPALIALWIASMSSSTILTKPFETNTMRLMGAASFSIYLFHEAILFSLRNLGWLIPDSDMLNVAMMILISLIVPITFHFAAEKKLNIWSKKEMLAALARFQEKHPRLKG